MSDEPTISLCDHCICSIPEYHDSQAESILDQLRAYRTPSDSEAAHFHTDIDFSERVIQKYEQEITKLQQRIEVLQAQRDLAKRAKETRVALLAPIKKLPIEVLEWILTLVCCGEDVSWYTDDCPFFVFPFTLDIAHTCSVWRKLVLTKGELWSNIDLLFSPVQMPRDVDKPIKLLTSYLSYSKSAPLTISIRAYPSHTQAIPEQDSEKFDDLVRRVLSVLLGQAGRWKCADLTLDSELFKYLDEEFLVASKGSSALFFPLLETLTLDWDGTGPGHEASPERWSALGDIFKSSLIHQISLPSYSPELQSYLPFSQITSLDIKEVDQSDLLLTLDACPALQRLKVQSYEALCLPIDETVVSCIQLIAIHLYVEAPGKEDVGLELFSCLHAPALQELLVHRKQGRVRWSRQAFASMISRSSCRLHTLSIRGVITFFEDIQTMLRLSPDLLHLEFHEIVTSNDGLLLPLARILTWTTATIPDHYRDEFWDVVDLATSPLHIFVPRLASLHLATGFSFDTDLRDSVNEMLRSRTSMNAADGPMLPFASIDKPSPNTTLTGTTQPVQSKPTFLKDYKLWCGCTHDSNSANTLITTGRQLVMEYSTPTQIE
ncbi:hypothetical protein D9758_012941 [Tetrapyrgos nigripes]|uniref:F-box domain-containing protein n=1 Tax=Tetrapyrgos nigripes TaxID=182062 RepID=A0A8H5FP46_9AGAR|nr:hypothetical protein D9758_012941 [Tetrapyrgos nigripes]